MKKLCLGLGMAVCLLPAAHAHAEVPAGYTGTPFKGTPWPIPGRIEFEDFDLGGQGVGWSVDDHTGNFGEGGCAANGYRDDLPHPQLCQTNTNPGENDVYTVGPLIGTKYPSDAMPQSIYIGYTHAVDWVKLTVNVEQAGTYKLSSSFGSEPGGADGIHVQVSFNDVVKADATMAGTGGYHNWADYPDFATVELEAGVQVLQFAPKSMHLNYDYLQLSLVLPDGSVDDGSGSSAGGGGGGGGTGGGAGAGGTGGTAGASVGSSGGSAGSDVPVTTAGSGGSAGAPPAGVAGTPSAGATSAPAAAETSEAEGGCAVVAAPRSSAGLIALVAAALVGAARFRRRSR